MISIIGGEKKIMLLNLAIIRIGISVGDIDSCEKLINSFISNDFKLKGESEKNSEKIALMSAFKEIDTKSVTVITDNEIPQEYNISTQIIENSFEIMICKARNIITSGKSDMVTLVCHSEDGCIAITVAENAEDRASKAVFTELAENTTGNKRYYLLSEQFLNAVISTIEAELSLDLCDNSGKYLCISNEKNKRIILLNNSEVTVISPGKHLREKFATQRYIIPLYFNSSDDAQLKLRKLKSDISQNNIYDISLKYSEELKSRSADSCTIVFLIRNYEELELQINDILGLSDNLMTDNFRWSDKTGSFYIKNSLLKPKIVFMNPPGGMFKKNIFYKFYSMLGGMQVSDGRQYFHLLQSKNEMQDRYLFEVAVTYITMILMSSIGISPDLLSGASMGELAFISSHKIIKIKKEGNTEDNLKFALKGINDILCEVLENQEKESEEYFGYKIANLSKWYLKCDYIKAAALIEKYNDVFIIIIGSPESVIICGENLSCTKIIRELGCVAIPLGDAAYVHTPILKNKSELIKRTIVDNKIYMDISEYGCKVFSTYFREYIDNTSEMLADNITSIIIEKVDYASAVSALYDKCDARIFIDLSTGRLAGTWANETLESKPGSEVISIFDDSFSCDYLLDICAKLLSFNVSFDYQKLLSMFEFIKSSEKTVPDQKITEQLSIKQRTEQSNIEQKNNNIKIVEEMNKTLDFSNEIKQCVLKQLENNKNAYKIYLESQNQLYKQAIYSLDNRNNSSENKVSQKKEYLWDRDEIITMTDTSMSAVLGDRYKQADEYPIRARMPLPPFLFISRIISIDAEFGKFQPSQIVAEYDLDKDCVLKTGNNQISQLVMSEAGHIGIFLMAYIGLDIISGGTLSYRALDSSQTYYSERPLCVGDTIRTVFKIHKFVKNGSTAIAFYSYDSYNGDELVSSNDGCGGFFTKSELMSNKGIINTSKEKINIPSKEFLHFKTSEKRSYPDDKIRSFFKGDYQQCFDIGTKISLKEKYYISDNIKMVDRVTEIDYNGGMYKCGLIRGEKNITPDLWPFKVHFKNDPVFPATLMIEGITQLYMILFAHSGILGRYKNTNVIMSKNQILKSNFRGQVRKENSLLKYEIHIKDTVESENNIYINCDAKIYNNEIQVIKIENCGLKVFDDTSNN